MCPLQTSVSYHGQSSVSGSSSYRAFCLMMDPPSPFPQLGTFQTHLHSISVPILPWIPWASADSQIKGFPSGCPSSVSRCGFRIPRLDVSRNVKAQPWQHCDLTGPSPLPHMEREVILQSRRVVAVMTYIHFQIAFLHKYDNQQKGEMYTMGPLL